MKINIQLNRKSIEQSKKQLIYVKKLWARMQKDFFEDVAMWLINRANTHLNNSDIGENVKIDIRNGWEYDFTPTGIKITNRTEKAVFVEFGVGIIGQTQSHPNASAEGYEYNEDSGSKSVDGAWTFYTNSNELDLPQSALLAHNWYNGDRGKGKGQRLLIMTKGAKGVWYAYNAIVDAQMELTKSGGGEIGKMWRDIKARYIK